MNIIVFGRKGQARHISISTALISGVLLSVMLVGAGAFAGGLWAAGDVQAARPVPQLSQLKSTLVEQQAQLRKVRGDAQEYIDALALKVGELNASVIRLNALGQRLTDMAGLDDGEFDFASAPALGGQEVPVMASASGQVADLMADISALDSTLYGQARQLDVLEDLMLNRKLQERVYPQGRPIRAGWMSSAYGKRTDPFTGKPASHRGVDFAGKAGSEIIAVGGGVVTWSGERHGYGHMVEINHGNGYVTRYGHNRENLVAVGDQVQPGQVIALMGSSGRSTGPHLHFEVWHLGRPVNPARHIREKI